MIEAGYVEPVEDRQNNKHLTEEEVEKAAAKAEKERLAAEKKAAAAAAKAEKERIAAEKAAAAKANETK